MKILAHVHSFNDEEIIDQTLESILNQTWPIQEILLVDNASTDSTLDRDFPKEVTLIRHKINEGTSGAVHTGMKYAIEQGYDWVWLFDADSLPEKNALEVLVNYYQSLPPDTQSKTWMLSSIPVEDPHGEKRHGVVYIPEGLQMVDPAPDQEIYPFHATIWSGCLYKLSAVKEVGLPSKDYVLDVAEYQYGYLGMKHGYLAFLHQGSIMRHSVGDTDLPSLRIGFGPFKVKISQHKVPAIRLYYIFRNNIYFWFYVYFEGSLLRYLRQTSRSMNWIQLSKFVVRVLLMSTHRDRDLMACLRGIRDGVFKKMERRY